MVAKINYGSDLFGAISYNHTKLIDNKAQIIYSNKIITNSKSGDIYTIPKIIRSFESYLSANSSIKEPVTHISINPHPEDNISDLELARIANEYLEKMGYKDQPFLIYKHEDIAREHIHIVTVRVKENGEKIDDSLDFIRSTNICRELEIKYGLTIVEKQDYKFSKAYLKKVDYQKGNVKQQISNTLKSVLEDYKFQSLGEYNALLSCFNIHTKYIKSENENNLFHGIVYSPTNDKGEITGNPINSSRISKKVGYENLQKIMKKNKTKIKEFRNPYPSKPTIAQAIKSATDKENFINILKNHNIDVVFRINDEGRIYGVTFLDHQNKIAFNGSRLGKEYSANIFNNLFNGNKSTQEIPKGPENFSQNFLENIKIDSFNPTSLDEMFGIFNITVHGNEAEEAESQRISKRKKKKKRKRRID